MAKNLHLHIPEPCHENWNQMTADRQGRFCTSCQKTVVDFTSMSDQEIIRYFQQLKSNTCGRFRDDQLNRDYASPRKRLNWYKYFLQVVIPALLVTSKSYSQGEVKNKPAICISPTNKANDARITLGGASAVQSSTDVQGLITDENGKPIPYATIRIKGTKQAVAADESGKFIIQSRAPIPFTLVIAGIGFNASEITVQKISPDPLKVFLQTSPVMGDVIVAGYTRRKRKPNVFHQFKQIITDTLKITSPKIYPNPLPLHSTLTIEYSIKKDGDYTVELFDQNGQLMQVERFEAHAGHLLKQIRLKQGIVAGTYIINLIGPDNKKISSQKLIADM